MLPQINVLLFDVNKFVDQEPILFYYMFYFTNLYESKL